MAGDQQQLGAAGRKIVRSPYRAPTLAAHHRRSDSR
jgi:hypothetical protein